MARCWLLTLVLSSVTLVAEAGWEQTCTSQDFLSRRRETSACSTRLTNIVFSICRTRGGIHRPEQSPKKRDVNENSIGIHKDIFSDRRTANSFLNTKRSNNNNGQGIVCECCIHVCSTREWAEYCNDSPRRKKRSLDQTTSEEIAEEKALAAEIADFYNEVETIAESDQEVPEIDVEDFATQPLIRLIERQKQWNIERDNYLAKNVNFEQKYNRLKSYLKEQLNQMLETIDDSENKPQEVTRSTTTQRSTREPEPSQLKALMELFKDEFKIKSGKR